MDLIQIFEQLSKGGYDSVIFILLVAITYLFCELRNSQKKLDHLNDKLFNLIDRYNQNQINSTEALKRITEILSDMIKFRK